MAQFDSRRFDDIRVGQALPAAAPAALGDARCWPKLAERYVQDWAGHGALIAQRDAPADDAGDEIDEIFGSIYARHLDDSLNVDVRVVGRTRSGARLVDIIRVRLH